MTALESQRAKTPKSTLEPSKSESPKRKKLQVLQTLTQRGARVEPNPEIRVRVRVRVRVRIRMTNPRLGWVDLGWNGIAHGFDLGSVDFG